MRTKGQLLGEKPVSAVGVSIGAGAALLAVMCLDAAVRGESAFGPFSLTASLVLGESASQSEAPSTILVGLVVGVGAAILEGLVFSWLMSGVALSRGWGRRLGIGLLYGAGVYAFAFQLIGRIAAPWVLQADQLGWFIGHAFVFGPLLAVMHEVATSRERERRGVDAINWAAGRTGSHGNPTGESS